MQEPIFILGLESSCDDTAAAVLSAAPGKDAAILSHKIQTQATLHEKFGGVVPEISARAHIQHLDRLTREALDEANLKLADITAVAVTSGPGLIGGLMSAVMYAKGLSYGSGMGLIGVNHLAGHALTPRLTHQTRYPYLMLLVSGGHCQFLIVRSASNFTRLGSTIDDAPGEAFDKVARLLGLPQPGGPSVEAWAKNGDPASFTLPRPLTNRDDCNLSFSGLKTALLRARDQVLKTQNTLAAPDVQNLCASFQAAVSDVLRIKTQRALDLYLDENPQIPSFCVAGGVAANLHIRGALERLCQERNTQFIAPPLALCTDNAAMIAYAGYELWCAGQRDDLSLGARPRWPLDQSQAFVLGAGKKGAKA